MRVACLRRGSGADRLQRDEWIGQAESGLDRRGEPACIDARGAHPLADTTRGCIVDITNVLARRHLNLLLAASPATIARLDRELGRYDDPGQTRARGPILIAPGTVDQDVP